MSILHNGEVIVTVAGGMLLTTSDPHIHDKSTVVLLHEESGDLMSGKRSGWSKWRDPDGPLTHLLVQEDDTLKDVNENFADEAVLFQLLSELDLHVVQQEVVLDVELRELATATARHDQLVKQVVHSISCKEVGTDSQFTERRGSVGLDTLHDSLESSEADTVVANVKEFQGRVDLEGLSKGSGTIDICTVSEEVQRHDGGIRLEHLSDLLHT